jgi:DNA-binding NtrC family response regulator
MNRELQPLVIDDEQPVCDFVTAMLRADGWQVTQSSSAEEALRCRKTAASRVLGVDRKTLNRMIERHQISFNKQNGDG